MKLRFKIAATAVIVLLVISLSLNIVSAVNTAVPGSDQDPIVSKSYVDAAFKELSAQIQMLIEQNDILKNQNTQLSTELTKQDKTIKTLQSELNALKTGTAAGTANPPAGSGSTGSGKTDDTKAPAAQEKGVVNTAVLNLRVQPNTTSTILGKLVKNDTVTIISKSNGWYKITTSSGKTGYVLGTLITLK